MILLYQDKKRRKKGSYLGKGGKMEKQKTKKRKINILKVSGLITQILSIMIMLKTSNKIIYTLCFINLLVQYFYIVGYKKEVKRNEK